MSTAAVRAPQRILDARQRGGRRVAERRGLAVPLNVTVLRSGVPDAVPGRSVDVCGGGVGAILAAELFPVELVGVEFELPQAGPVLAKARVCYQEKLRCGLQFLAIPAEQRAMIERWTNERREKSETTTPKRASNANVNRSAAPERRAPAPTPSEPAPVPRFLTKSAPEPRRRVNSRMLTLRYQHREVVMAVIASVIVALGMGWWQWEE